MRVYTAIRLPFLFHTSTISSKSLSVSFSGDSKTIFIKFDRLSLVKRLRRRFFINFMSEKHRSADAVEMEIDQHLVASICRFRNNAISLSLVTILFHSVLRSEETMAAFSYSVPSNNLAGKSLSNCPMRV